MLPDYTNYLARLRAAGCPEAHVRGIVVADVNEFFDQRRLKAAVIADYEWWKANTSPRGSILATAEGRAGLEMIRARLLGRLLGSNWAELVTVPALPSGLDFNLTGPVLGALPAETYNAAVEICRRSREQLLGYQSLRLNEGRPPDPVEEARLRNQTRQELARLLTAPQLEEFLVRNSHHADSLRQSLRGFNPSREEFLTIFRALDPIVHPMQLEYGGETALSTRQREDFQRQCQRAVREALPPERFKAYLTTLDPLYRRAQQETKAWGLEDDAVTPLYEFYRQQAGKRTKVLEDATLSEEQKKETLRSIQQEEQKHLSDLIQARRDRR